MVVLILLSVLMLKILQNQGHVLEERLNFLGWVKIKRSVVVNPGEGLEVFHSRLDIVLNTPASSILHFKIFNTMYFIKTSFKYQFHG